MSIPAHVASNDAELLHLLTHHGAADLVTATPAGSGSATPWSVQDELSQNRSAADVHGVITGLSDRGDHASAAAVAGRRP